MTSLGAYLRKLPGERGEPTTIMHADPIVKLWSKVR